MAATTKYLELCMAYEKGFGLENFDSEASTLLHKTVDTLIADWSVPAGCITDATKRELKKGKDDIFVAFNLRVLTTRQFEDLKASGQLDESGKVTEGLPMHVTIMARQDRGKIELTTQPQSLTVHVSGAADSERIKELLTKLHDVLKAEAKARAENQSKAGARRT
jgi:hypothetical protein